MSLEYRAIYWNRDKRIYDAILGGSAGLYLAVFIGTSALLYPTATAETLIIRGAGTLAVLLLHVILAIGPLCRMNACFLPLLYNRRHLGVTMFLVALVHGAFSLIQFHAGGDVNPVDSLLKGNSFQVPGFLALLILFAMAATSHDFWLHNLTPPVWKALHMSVYLAYALLIAHVGFGALHSETNPLYALLVGLGMILLIALHLIAAQRSRDQEVAHRNDFIEVCRVDDIPEKRARIVSLSGERVAVFRYDGRISAVSNVCQHQNGPLGEGKIVAGCITCPWHGYQYLPDSGAAPPPFIEKISTYRVKVIDDRVLVHPAAHPPGTRLEPACCR
jgi:sulfoxide reductase heme-binding subunit YedZ